MFTVQVLTTLLTSAVAAGAFANYATSTVFASTDSFAGSVAPTVGLALVPVATADLAPVVAMTLALDAAAAAASVTTADLPGYL